VEPWREDQETGWTMGREEESRESERENGRLGISPTCLT
jgi:hypothetical protein